MKKRTTQTNFLELIKLKNSSQNLKNELIIIHFN